MHMFLKGIRFYVTLVVICLAVFTHTGRSEAYSVATYSGGGTEWGKFAVDRSGKIYWASYLHYCNPESTRLNLHYSNGSSGLTWMAGTDSIGGHGAYTTVGSYVIDAGNIHWIAVNASQNGYYWSALYKYDGSTLSRVLDNQGVLRALGISPADGSMWMAGTGSYNGVYRWNGSWFEYKAAPGWEISAFGADYNNNFWAGGTGGQTAVWNGSSWTGNGIISGGPTIYKLLVNPVTRKMCAITSGGLYQYDGGNWVYLSGVTGPGTACLTVDGKIFDQNNRYGYQMYDSVLLGDGSIYAMNSGYDCAEGCWTWPVPSRYSYSLSSFAMTPNPGGATGRLKLNATFDGRPVGYAGLQYSKDGYNFSDLCNMVNGDAGSITPEVNNYWFRIRWDFRCHPSNPWTTNYLNTYGPVPTITSAPAVSASTGIRAWDSSRGRSWFVLSWPGLAGAGGYRLQIFDGNAYRLRDIGNVTSWDSRAGLVFPFPANLPENNSLSSDPFRWDGTGMDFEDTAVRLYRSTVGTGHDSVTGFNFKISAYNPWMETAEAPVYLVLPGATDTASPTGTISVSVPEGATAPAAVSLNLSAVTDVGSGLHLMRFSNDNASWYGWENFAVSRTWTTSPGEGEKTVYAQVVDDVGNSTTFSVSFWLGATLTQIYNEAQASHQKAEAARQEAIGARASSDEARAAAQSAATNSILAAGSAREAAERSHYTGKYGGSTESVGDIAGYMRNTQLPVIDSKVDSVSSAVNSINNTVTSINNSVSADTTSPVVSVRTLSGALATSGDSMYMIVSASDNRSSSLACSVNGGPYQALPEDGLITVPISTPGANVITVRVKDEAGNTGVATIVIRKL